MLEFPLDRNEGPGFRLSANLRNVIGVVGVESVIPATVCRAATVLLKDQGVLNECLRYILSEDRTSFDLPQLLKSMTSVAGVRDSLQEHIQTNAKMSPQWNPGF
jgi:hypothetical protein